MGSSEENGRAARDALLNGNVRKLPARSLFVAGHSSVAQSAARLLALIITTN
jgi:hypothetical protein